MTTPVLIASSWYLLTPRLTTSSENGEWMSYAPERLEAESHFDADSIDSILMQMPLGTGADSELNPTARWCWHSDSFPCLLTSWLALCSPGSAIILCVGIDLIWLAFPFGQTNNFLLPRLRFWPLPSPSPPSSLNLSFPLPSISSSSQFFTSSKYSFKGIWSEDAQVLFFFLLSCILASLTFNFNQ